MTKSELIEKIKLKYPYLSTKELKKVVDAIFNQLSESLANNDRIEIRGFGTFSIRERAGMNIKNPRTNESIYVGKRRIVYFRMGKEFKQMINANDD
jgi:integration host factor subunit beta